MVLRAGSLAERGNARGWTASLRASKRKAPNVINPAPARLREVFVCIAPPCGDWGFCARDIFATLEENPQYAQQGRLSGD